MKPQTLAAIQDLASEAQIQRAIVDELRLAGWLVIEYARPGTHSFCPRCRARLGLRGALPKGHPDLLCLKVEKPPTFIEVKKVGKHPDRDQRAFHDALRAAGAEVLVARAREDIACLL